MSLFLGWSIENYLSLASVGFGLVCSIYFVYDWLRHRREQTHTLLFAIGLALFYVFLIPFICVEFGGNIILTEWFNFFNLTVPSIFLGWAFVYWGIVRMKSPATEKVPTKFLSLLFLWVLVAFIFYAFRFSPTEYEKILSVIGIVFFFLAIHVFILRALWEWFRAEQKQRNAQMNAGIAVIAIAIILSIVRYLLILSGLMRLPQGFWFLTVADFDLGFILRSVVVILLAVGFFIAHKHYPLKSGM